MKGNSTYEKLPKKLSIQESTHWHLKGGKHGSTASVQFLTSTMWDRWRNKLTYKRSLILIFLGQKWFQLGVNPQVTEVWRANPLYCLHQIFRNGTILTEKNWKKKGIFQFYGLNMRKFGLLAQWLIFYIKNLMLKIYIEDSVAGLKRNTSEASHMHCFLPQIVPEIRILKCPLNVCGYF